MVGSTYRLTSSAKAFAKYLPLDTVSFRYIAWELDVQVSSICHTHITCIDVFLDACSCLDALMAEPAHTAGTSQEMFCVEL